MPKVDFLIGLISIGKKDLQRVRSGVYVCVCVATHTRVITVGGTDLHWFDMPSIFPSLFFHLLSSVPLSFHFLSSHLLSCHLILCLVLSLSHSAFSDFAICSFRTKTHWIILKCLIDAMPLVWSICLIIFQPQTTSMLMLVLWRFIFFVRSSCSLLSFHSQPVSFFSTAENVFFKKASKWMNGNISQVFENTNTRLSACQCPVNMLWVLQCEEDDFLAPPATDFFFLESVSLIIQQHFSQGIT